MFFKRKNYEDILFKKYGKCKEEKEKSLNVLFIADTHGCLEYEKDLIDKIKENKNIDYCFLLGDHSSNDLKIITEIIEKEKILGVLGNHDDWNKYKNFGIEELNGKVKQIKDKKISGISGSYKYKDSDNYALYTHEESIEIADNMEEADILISHDKAFIERKRGDSHDGLKGITEYLYKNKVPLHIHGHIHEESENYLKNGTKSICVYKVKVLEI